MLRFAPAAGSASSSSSSSSEADSGASDPLARSIFHRRVVPERRHARVRGVRPSSWRATAAASVLLSVRPGAEAWLANDCAAVVGGVGSVGSAPSAPGAETRASGSLRERRRGGERRDGRRGRGRPRRRGDRRGHRRGHDRRDTGDIRTGSRGRATVVRHRVPFLARRRARPRTERSRPRGSRSGSNRESDGSGARVDRDPRVSRLRRDVLPLHRRTATAFPTTRAPQFDV